MTPNLGRRSFILGSAAFGALALTSCATSGTTASTSSGATTSAGEGGSSGATSGASSEASSGATSGAKPDASGALTVQSNQSDPQSQKGMKALIAGFVATAAGTASLNTVAGEQFRTQLPTYLTSQTPPDVLTWLAGKVAGDYANKGLLLDVSQVWSTPTMAEYPASVKALSTGRDGKQIFIPQYYYWVAIYYRPSKFREWGVSVPKTWTELKTVAAAIQAKGVAPIGIGLSDTPWLASAWFDYLNIRVNGAQFHRDVLLGKASFADPKVGAAMDRWKEILPYFDKRAKGLAFQEAQTQLFQGRTGMFLAGSWFAGGAPKSLGDDLDFFQFPIIDPAIPVGEEGPTDGFFASARTTRPALTKKFLEYVATAPAQEAYLSASGSASLPTNPQAKVAETAANKKGRALLAAAKDVTQFFNRDGGDELQPTADTALVKFMDNPNDLQKILADWQTAAQKVRQG